MKRLQFNWISKIQQNPMVYLQPILKHRTKKIPLTTHIHTHFLSHSPSQATRPPPTFLKMSRNNANKKRMGLSWKTVKNLY